MADISGSAKTDVDIFRLVSDHGPLTLYAASRDSSFSLGTLHRHLKEMLRMGRITIYGDGKGGRGQRPYGPTVLGFVHYCRIDADMMKRLGNYFLLWIDHAPFRDDLAAHGFDVGNAARDPQGSKDLFCKYTRYYSLIEDQLEHLKKNWDLIPRDLAVFMGEVMLLTSDPSHFGTWKELYLRMPGLRKQEDSRIGHMRKLQIMLHRQIDD